MVLKVIEVLSSSEVSWEDAAKRAVKQAAKSIYNIRSIYIKDHSARVVNDVITEYKIIAKVTFALANEDDES